jgi:hypothetical protein
MSGRRGLLRALFVKHLGISLSVRGPSSFEKFSETTLTQLRENFENNLRQPVHARRQTAATLMFQAIRAGR